MITDLTEWIKISGNIIDIYTGRLAEIATRLEELKKLISEISTLI